MQKISRVRYGKTSDTKAVIEAIDGVWRDMERVGLWANALSESAQRDGRGPSKTTVIEAIDLVQRDVRRVELWANALGEFTQPAGSYDPRKYAAWLLRDTAKPASASARTTRPWNPCPGSGWVSRGPPA